MWKFNLAFFRHRLFLRIFWQGCIAAQQLPAWTELEHLFFSLVWTKIPFFFLVSYWYCCQKQKKTNQQLALFVVRFWFRTKKHFCFFDKFPVPGCRGLREKKFPVACVFFSRKKKISMLYKSFWFYIFSWISVG